MKIPPRFRPAIFGFAFGLTTSASLAEADYTSLIEALQTKNNEAATSLAEADLLMQGYQEYLDDPEIEAIEKPALRKAFLKEKARQTLSQSEIKRIKAAMRGLRRLQKDGSVDPKVFKGSYEGLEELSKQASGAWEDILSIRKQLQSDLRSEYQTKLIAAEEKLRDLKTRENVSKRLLDSVNSRRKGSNDAEFKLAMKWPSLKVATARGFGIDYQRGDEERHAQLILVALTGYSNYFWDHFDGSRAAGGKAPSDLHRNIFGVPDGRILLSHAISHNESNYYYLSDESRTRFNSRVRKIWGPGSLQVKRWNQRYSDSFNQACKKLTLSTGEDGAQPSEAVMSLIEEIDELLKVDDEARQAIAMIHSQYELDLSEAESFGKNVWLSMAAYNAAIWARESKELLPEFDHAGIRLAKQSELCSLPNWKPDTRGIQTSVRTINQATQRYPSVAKVRRDLEVFFGDSDEGNGDENVELPAIDVEKLKEDLAGLSVEDPEKMEEKDDTLSPKKEDDSKNKESTPKEEKKGAPAIPEKELDKEKAKPEKKEAPAPELLSKILNPSKAALKLSTQKIIFSIGN